MARRRRLLPLAAVLLIGARFASRLDAQGTAPAVTFTLRSAREPVAARNAPTTVIVAVANAGRTAVTVHPVLALPDRWRALSGTADFSVAARSRELWLLTIAGPPAPLSGRYVLGLGATIAGAGAWNDSVAVTVGKRIAARVRAPTGEPYAPTGDEIVLRYLVRNAGNTAATFDARAHSPLDGTLRLSKTRLDLGVGDSASVDVTVGSPSQVDRPTLRRVVLDVSVDGQRVDSAQTEALFVPPAMNNTARRLPVRLVVRTAGRANKQVSPVLLTSRGPLDEGGNWMFDLDLRGPGPSISPFGERDHYRFDLRSASSYLQLGDLATPQTRLTESTWQQFGLATGIKANGYSFAVFGGKDRYFLSRGSSGGATLGAPLPNDGTLTFNGAYFQGTTTRAGGVGSVATTFFVPGGLTVQAEGAGGAMSGVPLAGTAHVSRRGRRTWFDAEMLRADTAFPGPRHGSSIDFLGGGVRLAGPLALRGSLQNYTFYRPVLPSYDSIAFPNGPPTSHPRTLERLAGLSFGRFGAFDAVRRQSDEPGHDDLFRFTAVARLGSQISFVATGEDGRHVTPTARVPRWRTGLSTSWSTEPFTLNVFGDYASSASARVGDTGGRSQQISSGMSATLRVGSTWRASLLTLGNGSVATGVGWDSTSLYLVDGSISHDLPGGQLIALRVRSQRSAVRWFSDQTLVLLEYGLPIGLRLPSSGSRVTGRVVDQTTGLPVANALVRLGDAAAITDRAGRVAFPSLRAGTYPLAVASGTGDRPGVRAPAALDIDGAHATTFNIGVYPATHTRVVVRRWLRAETPIGGRAVDTLVLSDEPPASIYVTIVNGADSVRRQVLAGALDLGSELYPGTWTARIAPTDLPAGYEARTPETTFLVSPAADIVTTIDLIALQRIPRVLPGGEIKVVPRPPPKPAPTSPTPSSSSPPASQPRKKAPATPAPATPASASPTSPSPTHPKARLDSSP